MAQTLLMERVTDQVRLAVIEEDALCELYIRRPGSENVRGNVYLGRVENVLPGMNAAFVDIGLEKNGFLAAGDISPELRGEAELARLMEGRRIEAMVRPGQDVLVQVSKVQPGAKGPRLSCSLSLPGRTMVLLAGVSYVGVSKKIADPVERDRLREIGRALCDGTDVGLILRTAAQGVCTEELRGEFQRLLELYHAISRKADATKAPRLLHDDNSLALKAVRELLGDAVDALWVDDAALYAEIRRLAEALAPEFVDRVRLHRGETPLFDLYRVDTQAEKALGKYVWLDGGGSLVIEETEALTVIDVNTGKNVGKSVPEQTIFRNNCEAARELMRQLRLRDIGGIVVIDFIDMASAQHRQALLELLSELARRDRNRVAVADMTALGLVELTRRKSRLSLSRQLLHTCSHCGGNGVVASHETTARRIARDIWRRRRRMDGTALVVEASPSVCGWLLKIGAPPGGDVWLREDAAMEPEAYRLSIAEGAPAGCKLLKRGKDQ